MGEENHKGDITVILTGYRRFKNLPRQIESIQNQTVKPDEVWLWKNYHEENKDVNLRRPTLGNSHIVYDLDKTFDCNHNWKFYGRFAAALLAQTTYVAIFDDDTIPGHQWFENCLMAMKHTPGILGGAGIILKDKNYTNHIRIGWPSQNINTTQVDLVGHAWFFKQEWLKYLWMEKPPTFENGEDIQFSYMAQKYGGINTYCPPHPKGNPSLHSSLFGNELGIDDKATSQVWNHDVFFSERNKCVQNALDGGWTTVLGVKK